MGVVKYVLLCAAIGSLSAQAISAPLVTGLGGSEGYGDLSQLRNDDQSSNLLSLPFAVNFFGSVYSSFYVNNNGNVTFNGPVGQYTPTAFPISSQPMIAPYWGDVDTRCASCGAVYVASPNSTTAIVTWHDVGYYAANASKTNDFQLILSDRSTAPGAQAGDFDIEFRYSRLEWTTGDASGGVGGLGGVPAQAGYDAGDQTNFFTLPGSRTGDVLDLANTSNVSTETPGLWRFAIRNGSITTGDAPSRPLLPTVTTQAGYQFDFGVVLNQRVYIDPLIATGYDYVVSSGPNIASVLFPDLGDADGYAVYGFDAVSNAYDLFLGQVMGGVTFAFGAGGVNGFGVRDIDVSPALDPNNPTAFVTGLTFVSDGMVSLIQTPITALVGTPAPEPSTWAMMVGGFGMVGGALRRRRRPALAAA